MVFLRARLRMHDPNCVLIVSGVHKPGRPCLQHSRVIRMSGLPECKIDDYYQNDQKSTGLVAVSPFILFPDTKAGILYCPPPQQRSAGGGRGRA